MRSPCDAREKLCGTWRAFTNPCGVGALTGPGCYPLLQSGASQAARVPVSCGIASRSRNALTSRETPPTRHYSKIQMLVFP